MSNAKNLHDVSAIYFFILAFVYVFAVLAFRNGLMADLMLALMRVLDIPFALVALMYGGSTIYMQIGKEDEEEASPWAMVIFAVCLLLLGFVVFLNFAFPSQL
jgi:nicotinamide riboside transporter PnuC